MINLVFFCWPPMSLKTKLEPPRWSHGVPSIPRNLEKVQKYPQPVKWAIIFRANPSKLILKNIMFKYTCFVYGLLSLLSIGLNSSSKNNFLNKFCFWYGKCQNSIIILQLFLLKNQITSENFKYCKERKELSWAENCQTDNQSKAWICKDKFLHRWKRKIVLDYYNHFGKFLLTFTLRFKIS